MMPVGLFQHHQPTAVMAVESAAQEQFGVGEPGDRDFLAVAESDLKTAGHHGMDHLTYRLGIAMHLAPMVQSR